MIRWHHRKWLDEMGVGCWGLLGFYYGWRVHDNLRLVGQRKALGWLHHTSLVACGGGYVVAIFVLVKAVQGGGMDEYGLLGWV